MKNRKPWIGQNGKPLTTEALKILSKEWTPEIWESYLTSLESNPRRDEEVSFERMDTIESIASATLSDLLPNSDHLTSELLEDVKTAIEKLPKKKRIVIEQNIYLGKGQRTIAADLKISRAYVQKIRKSAMKTLGEKLKKHSLA